MRPLGAAERLLRDKGLLVIDQSPESVGVKIRSLLLAEVISVLEIQCPSRFRPVGLYLIADNSWYVARS